MIFGLSVALLPLCVNAAPRQIIQPPLPDYTAILQAITSIPPIPAEEAPTVGIFYSARNAANFPPMPGNMGKNVWRIFDGVFLIDDLAADTMPAMNMSSPVDGMDDGAGSNSSNECSSPAIVYGPDDLWLEITGTTNSGTSMTASFTIHLPSTNRDGVYGLYMSTNLSIPYHWTWVGRNATNQTNLVVSGLPMDMGFFRLGPATAIRPGFDQQILPANDDGFTDLVDIGFPINFFGTSRTQLYVNNNGNVAFDRQIGAYTPIPIVQEASSVETDLIAPYWADVDTRLPGEGVGPLPVSYGTNTVDGRLAFGVDWSDVAYFSVYANHGFDKSNTFQLVFVDRSDRASGDYDVEFNYSQVQWETGDASGGSNGLGGTPARIGFATHSVTNQTFELAGSGTSLYFLDTNPADGTFNPTGLIYTNFNSTVPGRYIFQFHEGAPIALPPGSTNPQLMQLSPQSRMLMLSVKPENN